MSAETQKPTTQQLEMILRALLREREELKAWLAQVPDKEKRLKALNNGWNCRGEIEQAKLAVRDSKLPIFREQTVGWGGATRIVSVDDKWITLREDGYDDDTATRYKRSNGWEERRRTELGSIDAAKALEIWETHLRSAASEQTEPTAHRQESPSGTTKEKQP